MSENSLDLVGVSWMTASNDDFVNQGYGKDEKEMCKGRKGFPCGKDRNPSSANVGLPSVLNVILLIVASVVVGLK